MMHYLRHENKVNANNKMVSYCEALRCKKYKCCFPLCQTYKPTIIFSHISKKWTNRQEANGLSTAPSAGRTISCKVWNSTVQYPSRKCKHDINESEENIQKECPGTETSRGCAFAESELLSYLEHKHVVQKVRCYPGKVHRIGYYIRKCKRSRIGNW